MSQRYYSNIYWHFTGSPPGIDWREVNCPNDITKQNPILNSNDAKETLKKILDSGVLWGSCVERILDGLETEKFCCVTDIPLKDLPSHAPYYGKVAIGFTAMSVHKSFVPVLYMPKQKLPVIERLVPNRQLTKIAYDFLGYQGSFQEQQANKIFAQASANKETIREQDLEKVKGFFMNFVKMTDFDSSPENTFYREREWRNIGDFKFELCDVSAIVVPAAHMKDIHDYLAAVENSEGISVLAWELIENS